MREELNKRGYWEQEDHNPLIGGIIVLCLVTFIYFMSQIILVNGLMVADMIINTPDFGGDGDLLSHMAGIYRRYKYLIFVVLTLCQWGIMFGLTALFYKKWHGGSIRGYFYLDRIDWLGLLLAVLGAILIIPGVNFIARLSYSLFPIFEKLSQVSLPLFQAGSPLELALTIGVIGVTPAVCEEFLFRGYFQRTLQRKLAAPWSFILTGVIFAIMHQQILSLPALMVAGIFLSFIYYRFQSLYLSMAAHFVYNSTLVLFTNFPASIKILLDREENFSLPVTIISSLFFLLVVTAMALYGKRRGLR